MRNQLKKSASSTVETTTTHKPAFFNPEILSWTPWAIEGTEFKLLNINAQSGGFTMLLRVEPGNESPVHGHLGAVEGFIMGGGFGYGDDRGREGWYVYETSGIRHAPDTDDDGMVMFAVAYGPIVGYEDDGSVAAVLDGKTMYQMASDNGAAGHLEIPPEWT
ncbi:MAG: anti-sigma factor ChrR (cupin superfamily) [Alcanivorax sp.]|jgi:anti-sigma factor ChrR (cupin superfamily)